MGVCELVYVCARECVVCVQASVYTAEGKLLADISLPVTVLPAADQQAGLACVCACVRVCVCACVHVGLRACVYAC